MSSKRKEVDMMKLMMSSYEVSVPDETQRHDFYVKFFGPAETPYHGGVWKVHVLLPAEYPYKSPSIGFMNRIFHPNIDERSGSVCLDVINQTWSPLFDLVNIFESFLPQLLRYPNPADPLNGEAAALHMDNIEKYNTRVRDHVAKHASSDIRLTEDDDRKISSESTNTTIATDRHSDIDNDVKEIADGNGNGNSNEDGDGDGDVDDGASDVSNMSDL